MSVVDAPTPVKHLREPRALCAVCGHRWPRPFTEWPRDPVPTVACLACGSVQPLRREDDERYWAWAAAEAGD